MWVLKPASGRFEGCETSPLLPQQVSQNELAPAGALESSPAEPVLSLPKETAGKRFEKDGVPLGTAEWQPISRPCRDCSSYRWLYPACLPAIFNRA